MKHLPAVLAALAFALFAPLFVFRHLGGLDFWWWMAIDLVALLALAWRFDRGFRLQLQGDIQRAVACKLLAGLGLAGLLYGVFWIGNDLSRSWFDFAPAGIQAVYDFKGSASIIRIALLMLLVIGPGEELFWRAFLQHRLQDRLGKGWGLVLATAMYTAVHLGSGNPMLVLAAAVCGLLWGVAYLKSGSWVLVVASHTVWDVAVFLIWPLN